MAQVEMRDESGMARAARLVKDRPLYLAVAALVLALLAGVCALGALQAGGVVIERQDEGAEGTEELRADDDAGAGDEGAAAGDDSGDGAASETAEGDGGEVEVAVPTTIVVDVAGAVVNPSVVTLAQGARVNDAIAAAGGLLPEADASKINRAAPLADGAQVFVPLQGEEATSGADAAAAGATGTTDSETSGGAAPSPVNINSAGLDELDALPGIGPSTAQSIIDDRTQNGPFASVEDIMRVSGIGEKKFEKLSSLICV